MGIILKKMETDEEIKGKAYVHWKSWHEAYVGIVSQEYLNKLTLAGLTIRLLQKKTGM